MPRNLTPSLIVGLGVGAALAMAAQAAPLMRAGEWRTRTNNGPAVLICHSQDHVMDGAALNRMMSMHGGHCEVGPVLSTGPATTFSVVCAVGSGRMTAKDTVTSSGPDTLTSHVHSHFEGGSTAIPDMDITQVAQRLGPCQPGDRPTPY